MTSLTQSRGRQLSWQVSNALPCCATYPTVPPRSSCSPDGRRASRSGCGPPPAEMGPCRRCGVPARPPGTTASNPRLTGGRASRRRRGSAAAPRRQSTSTALLPGVLVAVGRDQRLPTGTEAHLAKFTELAGTVVAAAQARRELRTMADEQAALRRVAELVAHGAALDGVFAAVATEASTLVAAAAAPH